MRFVGLSDPTDVVSFQEALENGVPRDSHSVYVPEFVPRLSPAEVHGLVGADPVDIGKTMLRPYVEEEIPEGDLDSIVREATTFEIPLVDVGDRKVLEVFHGPTGAFKDVAAQYIGAFTSYFYEGNDSRRSIFLVATSGDTGGAIARGLENKPGIDVVIGYPKGRVSSLQQEQLRRVAPNIHPLEIDGSFDDCLKLTEEALGDEELQEHINLTTANSINIGRWLPQITFHAAIYSQLGEAVRVVVPTGNEGNLGAGVLGMAMGVPSRGYVGAMNANDSLVRYLNSGRHEPTESSVRTHSNAMDVADPKNWPRLQWLFHDNLEEMKSVLNARRVTDDETVKAMKYVHAETGYVLDPHTAVGWAASRPGDVIVSTASPLKFADEIEELTGIKVDNSTELAALREREERFTPMPNDPEAYKEFIRDLQRDPVAA